VAESVSIRPELPGDREAVDGVVRGAFARHPDEVSLLVERIRASAHYVPELALVAEDESGDFVGFCTGYQDMHSVRFGYRVWVEDLAVDPERRSQGIGKALLDAAKAWARERGATHLELDSAETRADAHRFYEREQPSWRSVCFAWEL